jgi:hypothetical protein
VIESCAQLCITGLFTKILRCLSSAGVFFRKTPDEREFIAKPAQYLNMLIAWPLGLPVGVAVASEFSVVNSAVAARIEPSNGFWPINSSFDCRGHDRRTDRLR